MLFRYLVFLLLSAAGGVVSAQSFDINLSNDTAEFNLNAPLSSGFQSGRTDMNFGFLYTTDDDYMGMVGLQVMGSAGSGSPGLSAGLGVKAFGGNTDRDNDFIAITLGGRVSYSPPGLERLSLEAYLNYSPDIVTLLDADNFIYWGGRVSYKLLEQANVFLGYRDVRIDPSHRGSHETIDNGGNIGVEVFF